MDRYSRWFAHHHLHRGHHAGAYVGRTGNLAVALGIGTAAVTGSCLACATASAEPGYRGSSSSGSNSSTSQSVQASRRGSPLNPSAVADAPARQQATRAAAAATRPPGTSQRSRTAIDPTTPDPLMAPPANGGEWNDTAALISAEGPKALQPAAMPLHPAVVVVSPAAASPTHATTFTNVLTSLSKALNDSAPKLPVDASMTTLVGAARRETAAPLRAGSTPSGTAAAATATSSATTTTSSVEVEKMSLSPGGSLRVVYENKASGRSAVAVAGGGSVSTTVTIPASTILTIRARSSSGAPNMTVSIDGVPITTVVVTSRGYTDYAFAGSIAAGTHSISISSSNATPASTLYLDRLSTSAGPVGDQFSGKAGSAANSAIWTTTTGTGWDSGIQNYVNSGAYQDGQGRLVIQATRSASGGYTSGRVQTANKMSFGYGTITARIKVPAGQALWPAFWLIGADEATNGWPGVGEIDVMELPSTTTTMYSTLHGPIAGSTATQQAQIISTLPDLSTDYHDYWVLHLPNVITFGVDDQTLGTLTPADLAPGESWVYNRPMSVIINLAVGGPWAGNPDSTTPATAQMLVDSVTFSPV